VTGHADSRTDNLSDRGSTDPHPERRSVVCFIGLGSNLGNREDYLRQACEALRSSPRVAIRRVSSSYETEPWGFVDQPAFLNAVVEIVTELEPIQLFCTLQRIERELGRKQRFRWGPREIDLDLLLYGDRTVARRGLVVPHPAMYERAFVLAPLVKLAPWLKTPGGEPIRDILARLNRAGQRTTIQTLSSAPAELSPGFDNRKGVD
jgi:2-amino-4-hydroxy-6-hydroxymethyldihydropteridine diphosphokinase